MLLVEETEEAEREKRGKIGTAFFKLPPGTPHESLQYCLIPCRLTCVVDLEVLLSAGWIFWAWCLLCLGYLRILYAVSFVPGVCLSCCGPLGWGWWVTYSADCYSEQSFFILSFHPVLLLYIICLSAAWWLVIWVLVTDSVQFPTSGSPTHNSFCSIQ